MWCDDNNNVINIKCDDEQRFNFFFSFPFHFVWLEFYFVFHISSRRSSSLSHSLTLSVFHHLSFTLTVVLLYSSQCFPPPARSRFLSIRICVCSMLECASWCTQRVCKTRDAFYRFAAFVCCCLDSNSGQKMLQSMVFGKDKSLLSILSVTLICDSSFFVVVVVVFGFFFLHMHIYIHTHTLRAR